MPLFLNVNFLILGTWINYSDSTWKMLTTKSPGITLMKSLSKEQTMPPNTLVPLVSPPVKVPSKKRHWDLSVVSKQSLWILAIALEKGVPDRIRIEHRHLGLTEEEARTLKVEDGVDEVRITAFDGLNRAYNKLIGQRKKLQKKRLQCFNDIWFALDSEKGEIQEEIDAMIHEADLCMGIEEREPDDDGFVLTEEVYEEGRNQFCDRIRSGIRKLSNGRLTETQIDELVESEILPDGSEGYRWRFPELEVIQNRFGVSCLWLHQIESLQKSAEHDAEMKEALAKYMQAAMNEEISQAEYDLARKRIEAEFKIQKNNETMLRQTCEGLFGKIRQDLFVQIQQNLDVIQKIQQGELVKSNTKTKIQDALAVINRMSSFAQSLHELGLDDLPVDLKEAIASLNATQSIALQPNFSGLEARIIEIKESLDRARGVTPTTGHKQRTMSGLLL